LRQRGQLTRNPKELARAGAKPSKASVWPIVILLILIVAMVATIGFVAFIFGATPR
jgi:hypothetical protein